MKKKFIRTSITSSLIFAQLLTSQVALASDYDSEIANAQEAQSQVEALDSRLSQVTSSSKSTQDQLRDLEAAIADNEAKLAQASGELESSQGDYQALLDEIDTLEANIEKRADRLKDQARAVQTNGQISQYIDFIIQSESLTDAFARLDLVVNLFKSNQSIIKDQVKDKEALEAIKEETGQSILHQADLVDSLEVTSQDLEQQRLDQEVLLAQLAAEQAQLASERDQFIAQRDQAQAQADRLFAQSQEIALAQEVAQDQIEVSEEANDVDLVEETRQALDQAEIVEEDDLDPQEGEEEQTLQEPDPEVAEEVIEEGQVEASPGQDSEDEAGIEEASNQEIPVEEEEREDQATSQDQVSSESQDQVSQGQKSSEGQNQPGQEQGQGEETSQEETSQQASNSQARPASQPAPSQDQSSSTNQTNQPATNNNSSQSNQTNRNNCSQTSQASSSNNSRQASQTARNDNSNQVNQRQAKKPAQPQAKPQTQSVGQPSLSWSSIQSTANSYLGTPYRWGGSSRSGLDCSGFTQLVYSQHGISLPRNSRAQYAATKRVSNPAPGDLIFFGNGGRVTHVGIYAGGGQFIGSQTSTGVAYANAHTGYWGARFIGYGRVN